MQRRAFISGGLALLGGCGRVTQMRQGLEFSVNNTRLLMRGAVNRRTPRAFADVLTQIPEVTTVVFQDMRGSHNAQAVQEMGGMIRTRGLYTALQSDGVIHGAAVGLFIAGVQRRMVEGAEIGLGPRAVSDEGAFENLGAAYVQQMLGSDAFYRFALQAGAADGIHVMTEDEIAQYGLLTAPAQRFE